MKIKQITLGQVMTNCYVVELGNTIMIIDPVTSDYRIDESITSGKNVVILLTHGHFDHILGTDHYSKKYNAPVFIHQNDLICLENGEANLSVLFGIGNQVVKTIPIVLSGTLGNVPDLDGISYMLFPGHSRGQVAYYFEKQNVIFTGDLVFAGSIGRYDLPRCSEKEMKRSIQRFFSSEQFQQKNPTLYPGHGPKTTFQTEITTNQMVQLFLEEE